MTTYYSDSDRFIVSVDCVIFGLNHSRLSLLLARRRFEPEMGRWSLMGGFVRAGESVDNAAKRVLLELTGLDDVYMQQVGTFGDVNRDPGARVISVAYCALINFDEHDRLRVASHDAQWVELDSLPELGFDHSEMVAKALSFIKQSLATEPIAFSLMPRFFTLTQLQQLYEAVAGESIDKRNFRKRVAENPCVEKTEMIDKTTSRRGAALYRYNPALDNGNFHI
ncbi:MAG: NUDIX domain-containing protein [Muribaculaceae bacterium]|nr:NUDIX domain-containing protein [Muribaculaceae bacterium]